MKKKLMSLIISSFLLTNIASCNNTSNDNEYVINESNLKVNSKLDNNQTFYEIFVGSFSDSNNDGIGDLRGLINRLDYLNDGDPNSGKSLGVTGIWLMPIFESYSYHKYDVVDYYAIDKDYGTLDDLKELISECDKRGITLIIDLPINHTSIYNDWFIKFKNALSTNDLSSKYASYYSYCKLNESLSGRVTAPLGTTNYRYECNFDSSMPELDFDNEEVRKEVINIAKYYLDLGVDGFRFDAAKYIYYGDNQKSIEFWDYYMNELRKINPDVYCVGEVWDGEGIISDYYKSLNCFDFSFSQQQGYIAQASKGGNVNSYVSKLISYNKNIKNSNSRSVMAPFISNHDMDRAAGYLSISSGDAYSAANLLLLTNSTPFIYYGEEIGIKGSRGSSNTDANRRLKMLWGDDDTVKDPEGATYSIDKQVNGTVKSQKQDSTSLYNHYKKLIMMRNANKEITDGTYKIVNLKVGTSSVGGFIATLDNSSCLVIHNTSSEEYEIDISDLGFFNINSYAGLDKASIDNKILKIGPKTSVILK